MPNQAAAYTVRRGIPADQEAIARFNTMMAMETEGKALDQDLLRKGVNAVFEDAGRAFYLVAEAGGTVIGQLMITFEWSDWRNAWFWWIQSVFVHPEWRRRGVYTALHESARDLARRRTDVCGFRLYVERHNEAAQEAYLKAGLHHSQYDLFEE